MHAPLQPNPRDRAHHASESVSRWFQKSPTVTRLLQNLLLAASLVTAACARAVMLAPTATVCAAQTSAAHIKWLSPETTHERDQIRPWCDAVGPPLVREARHVDDPAASLAIVSWNTHEGAGRVTALIDALKSGALTGGAPVQDFVVLAQEVARAGPEVPRAPPRGARWAAAIQPDGPPEQISAVADRFRLSLFYVPSMRNGAPSETDEDRGNAILSTRPLTDLTAVELPTERQRRVAVAAAITGADAEGTSWTLRVVSVHLTNIVRHHLWIFAEPGRARQARALAVALDDGAPIAIGGDLNSWFGFHDNAYAEFARRFNSVEVRDRRPTFGPLRLDHMFFRLPAGWHADVRRANDRFGSDHYPLVATITRRS